MNYMEEDKAVRNFIIIFVIVLLLVVGIYFFTLFVNKDNETKTEDTNTTTDVTFDYDKAIVGTMLQANSADYYVILYKTDDDNSYEYKSLVSQYKSGKDAKTILTVDLSEGLNSKYYDKEHQNLTSENINDLRFGDITLLQVKKNKIEKAFDSIEKIKKELKIS